MTRSAMPDTPDVRPPSPPIAINASELRLQEAFRQVPEWELAGLASIGLAQVLLALPPRSYEGPRSGAGPVLQLYAQQIIGIRIFRTVRAAMAVLAIGYEPETRALDRIIVELIAHRKAIDEDPSGEEARLWLDGKRDHGISAKVNAMQPTDMYRHLSQDSHGDPRAVWRLFHEESGAIILGPTRRPLAARASLLMYAGVCVDQAGIVAALAGLSVGGHEELAERVRAGWRELEANESPS